MLVGHFWGFAWPFQESSPRSHRIFFGSALEDFSLDGSTVYLCTRILSFFLFVLYFCHMSCGRKVQLRAQLSGAWEGKGGEPRRCFPRDSRPGRGAGDQESGECGLSNRESVTGCCWSRLRAPRRQDCELRDLDRRHHDPHRPPRQGPPTVSCLVFLSFFLSASSPIHAHCHHLVTSADIDLTKICQNTSIL